MTTITPEALRAAILAKLTYAVGKDAAPTQAVTESATSETIM